MDLFGKTVMDKAKSAGFSAEKLAESLKMSRSSLWRKLHGRSRFSADELRQLKDLLNLSDAEFMAVFSFQGSTP